MKKPSYTLCSIDESDYVACLKGFTLEEAIETSKKLVRLNGLKGRFRLFRNNGKKDEREEIYFDSND